MIFTPTFSSLLTSEKFSYSNKCLSFTSKGSFHSAPALANIKIAGLHEQPQHASLKIGGKDSNSALTTSFDGGVLQISGLDKYTVSGAFEQDFELNFG